MLASCSTAAVAVFNADNKHVYHGTKLCFTLQIALLDTRGNTSLSLLSAYYSASFGHLLITMRFITLFELVAMGVCCLSSSLSFRAYRGPAGAPCDSTNPVLLFQHLLPALCVVQSYGFRKLLSIG